MFKKQKKSNKKVLMLDAHQYNIQLSGRVYAGNNMCIFSPPRL